MAPDVDVELPDPTHLWASWSRFAAALGALDVDDVWWTGQDGRAGFDDHGGSGLHLTLVDGGRALLHGWDRDATFDRGDVTRHSPPVDLFAGSPDWLPFTTLQALAVEEQLGWLYWFDPASGWSRAPYPEAVGDGSAQLLAPLRDPEDGLAALVEEWVEDEESLPSVHHAVAHAVTEPAATTSPEGSSRPAPLTMSVEEQFLLAEAAARAGYEAPRPTPPRTGPLEQVTAAVRAAVPAGARGSLTAWLGAGSATMTQHGAIARERLDVWGPLRELREAEAAEHGRWSFVTVVADPHGVQVWRAYDTVPTWWVRGTYAFPSVPDRGELQARPERWRPDWADLLETTTRTEGVPTRFSGLARRVLGRPCRLRP